MKFLIAYHIDCALRVLVWLVYPMAIVGGICWLAYEYGAAR